MGLLLAVYDICIATFFSSCRGAQPVPPEIKLSSQPPQGVREPI